MGSSGSSCRRYHVGYVHQVDLPTLPFVRRVDRDEPSIITRPRMKGHSGIHPDSASEAELARRKFRRLMCKAFLGRI